MRHKILNLAVIVTALISAHSALADIKVKSKQTMSGQSYENTTYIKGKRQRTESMNGMMINITQCDLRRAVQVNPNTKTYMVNHFADTTQTAAKSTAVTGKNGVVEVGGKITTTITVKDTGERKQMFGYTARHLIITMETVSSPDACSKTNSKIQTDGWYIDFEPQFNCDYGYSPQAYNNNSRPGGCQDKYEMKTIGNAKRGYPVYEKMTMFDESGKETYSMVNEVVELSKTALEASLFDVPERYQEVSDATQLYSGASVGRNSATMQETSILAGNARRAEKNKHADETALGAKKQGVIRIGLPSVKSGSIGEGIASADLSAAIQNTLARFLKVPNVEVVTLDSSFESAINAEASQKECDYVIYATASHKKGGGGFGMFKSFAPILGSVIPIAGAAGGAAGHVAGTVASHAIITAASVSGGVKSKDEISLDLKLNKASGALEFAKVYKVKARSDGEDIISSIVEQAAQGIVDAAGKSKS